ncbi:MAG TPA: Ig-like domain-containing protein [Patescibacteria group bacterium]|nr:Ig-like domain-containing protein [Patescibacteria group bacterium]
MKTKKTAPKRSSKASRPLHKRLLLHPFSVMVLLCTGVVIGFATYQSYAESYDVTATVPATPPSAPAVITSPYDAQHFNSKPIDVVGSCPSGSYVKLYRNSAFSGVAQCVGNNFQIQTDLSAGANRLQAKVYNITNQEGPASGLVDAYFDNSSSTPKQPASTPTDIRLASIDNNNSPQNGAKVSSMPTLSGYAPPFADIVVTVHSDPVVCKTQADSSGWWSCTLDKSLPAGIHHVNIVATTVDGNQIALPAFDINVLALMTNIIRQTAQLQINSEYQYQAHFTKETFSWNISLNGGQAPYKVQVEWGDGSHLDVDRTDGSAFVLTHAYDKSKNYAVTVTATDANGITATIQLSAAVKGYAPVAANQKTENLTRAFSFDLKHYLWVVWPAYLIIAFMVLSYWLGEREMYQRFIRRSFAKQEAQVKKERKR